MFRKLLARLRRRMAADRCGFKRKPTLEALESRLAPAVNVLTYHYDIASTGQNLNEIQLSPANVKVGSFGKVFTTPVNGQVYAEPLVDTGVTIANGPNTKPGAAGLHDVVFVATEHDSFYAIDATIGGGAILWQRTFLDTTNPSNNTLGASAITSVPNGDTGSADINPEIGITGTPVIDPATNTLYLVAKTKETVGSNSYYVQRLHAINITDGTDRAAPYVIGYSDGNNGNHTQIYAYGTGDGSVTDPYNGTGKKVVQFNALREAQRGALSLVNNTVYVQWASHGDDGPYHGWVACWDISNVSTTGFKLTGVLNANPNSGLGGIWQGGGRLAFEADGSAFYFETGNGGFDSTLNASGFPSQGDYGDSLVKATADPTTTATNQNINGWGLKVVDYFSPFNQAALDSADEDFGSGGPLLLPDSTVIPGHPHLMVVGGKEGKVYLVDRDNLGKFDPNNDHVLNAVPNGSGQNSPPVAVSGLLSTAAYYNGKIYVTSGYGGSAYSFVINANGTMTSTSQTTASFGYLPGSESISANGSTGGIVWVMDRNANLIHAYDAGTFATELWNSSQKAGGADSVGAVVKFAVPTEANGEVYVGTTNSLVVYGLTPPATGVPNAPSNLTATALSGSSVNLTWQDTTTPPNTANGYLIEQSTDNVTFAQITTAQAGSLSLAVGGLQPSTKYYFRIRSFNGLGNSQYSNIANATTTNQVAVLDFSAGFVGSTGTLTYNGSAVINGTKAELTDGGGYEAASVFSTSPVDITKFTTQFTFQTTGAAGTSSGITFCIQAVGPTALGQARGGLGYGAQTTGGTGGIPSSVAVKFDLGDTEGEGPNSTGLYTNGAAPTNIGAIDLTPLGLDLHSGDVFLVNITYDGATLAVTIKDTQTNVSATQNYTINIPATVGQSGAYVGFTGSTGGSTSTQDILTWLLSPNATQAPATPTALGAQPASATSISLTWTNTATNQTGFHLDRATDSGFTQNLITQTLPGSPNSFLDTYTGLAPGGTFYYRLRAFNTAGDSGNSNMAAVSIPLAPPKPSGTTVVLITPTEIDLTWTDNAGLTAQNYIVLRQANNTGGFTQVATLPPLNATPPAQYPKWADTNLTPGTYYEYHVQAVNISGNNDFNGTNATTISLPPTALSATLAGGVVNLAWTAPTAFGGVTYNIYRGTTVGGEGASPIASNVAGTSYGDNTIVAGQAYYYKVTAVNANATRVPPLAAESAFSNEASPPNAVPIAPTLNAATATSSSSIALTWQDTTLAPNTATSYGIEQSTDNINFTQVTTANQGSTSVTVNGLLPATPYYFRIRGFNVLGPSGYSNTRSATTPSALDFSGGFAGSTSKLTYNGSAVIVGTKAELTDGGTMEAASVFATNPVNVAAFSTQFTFQTTAGAGTSAGITFCIQGVGPTALGPNRGGLGYGAQATGGTGGIAKSVAVKFDLGDSQGEGVDSTGLYTNGAAPTNVGSIDLTPTGIDLHSGDIFQVNMTYNGTTLAVTIKDTKTGVTATQNYAINIPGTVGSSSAYVGFTGSTGGATSTQDILTWIFTPGAVSPPLAPTNLAPTAGNGQVTLNWTASTGATSYNMYRSTTSGAEISVKTGVLTTSYLDSGLTNGQIYYYEVSAVGAGGESNKSGEVFTTPQAAAPAPPTNLQPTAANAQIILNWTASTGAASYNIYRSTTTGTETSIKTGVLTTTYTDTGLTNGQIYYYKVTAVNAGGESNKSSEASATPIAPPAPPTNLQPTAGNTQIALSWTAPTGAVSYNIYRNTTSGTESIIKTGVLTATYTDTGLTNGQIYYYQVSAVNSGGEGNKSGEVSATPQVAAPAPPTNLQPTAGNSQIILNWTASTGAASYNIYRSTTSGTETSIKTGVLTTTYTDTGLTNGQIYYYKVTAVNPGGESNKSGEASATPIAPPSPPTNLQPTAGNTQITLSWTAPTGAVSYNIYRSSTSGTETSIKTGMLITTYNDTGLTNGQIYYYKVTAVNAGGEGNKSGEVSATPQVPAPAPPTNLQPTAGNTQVALTWTASTGAASYSIYRSTTSGAETSIKTGVLITTYTDTGLTNGQIYYYKVTAVNPGGESNKSSEVSATPSVAPSVPNAPTNLAASALSGSAIQLTWQDTTLPPNSATSYKIEQSTDNITFAQVTTAGAGATSATIGSLQAFKTYYFRIRGANNVGNSLYSNTANATTLAILDFTAGFATSAAQLTYNGSAVIKGTKAELTDGGSYEAASIFSKSPITVSTFTTQFTFQTNPGTNTSAGFTFCVQGVGPTAIGQYRGGLGYGAQTPGGTGGIAKSVAVKFDLADSNGEGIDSTGLYTNGVAPMNVGAINLTPTGVNLHNGNVFQVNMSYNGTTLTVTIKDTVTAATATQNYTVNIPSIVGGSAAYVGFTGSTGGLTAIQDLLTWYYDPPAPAKPATTSQPAGPSLTATSINRGINLSWSPVPDAVSYIVYRSTTPGGADTKPIATGTSGTSFVDTKANAGTTYYYKVTALNRGGKIVGSLLSEGVLCSPE